MLQVPLNTALAAKKHGIVDRIIVFCSQEAIVEYLPQGVEFIKRPEYLDRQTIECADIIDSFVENGIDYTMNRYNGL